MSKLQSYFPFTLRLYARVLCLLGDGNFTGLDLFYGIKDCLKGRDEPKDLLLKPLEIGLPYKIGQWCFDSMFDIEGHSASMTKKYYAELDNEGFVWFIEDLIEACRLSGQFKGDSLLSSMKDRTDLTGELYDRDEHSYWEQIDGELRNELIAMFQEFCSDRTVAINEMNSLYAFEVADRILHDRQLCHFVAERVIEIGFDGETEDGMRSQWVEREYWPARVKKILNARDRGRCAACGIDIVQELNEEGHIDHMFPISSGGCNDLVNLQLLCSPCNGLKLATEPEISSSIPRYLRRRKPKKL